MTDWFPLTGKGNDMGDNYYLQPHPPCECCGRQDPPLHIGKSSAGWVFSLAVYPAMGINDLTDWETIWEGKTILDEYDHEITVAQMKQIITERKAGDRGHSPTGYSNWTAYLSVNRCEWGPNNLLRGRVGGGIIRHGEGTYDLCEPGFS